MADGYSFCWPFVIALISLVHSSLSSHSIVKDLKATENSNPYHHSSHQSRMQVFVQTPTELRLVIDGLAIQSAADLVDYALLNGVAFQTPPLRFDPGEVDFGETEYATAAQRRVTVHNPSNAVVHLLTITGSTAHYHCSFFEDNILFPGANTSFDVYFLPRERGNLSSVLEIHTSIGVFALKLRGTGVESRYHMLPAINMKLPTNATFIYLMSLYNPFPKSLQITEIFTSSAELHLELVTGNEDEDMDLWHLQPYETRPILFLEFKGRESTHFIAYVVIILKTQNSKSGVEIVKLFIPVDFEVTEGVGLFPTSPILDFGIVSPNSPILTLPLALWNGYSRPVLLQNVSVTQPNPAVSVDFLPSRMAADYSRQQKIAFVSLNASMLTSRQQLNGEISITVKGSQNNTAIIPYRIRYISDNLQALSVANLSFNCQDGHCDWHAQPRYISLVNRAKSQIILYEIVVKQCEPHSPYQLFLDVKHKNLPAMFAPNQSRRDLLSVNVRKVSSEDSKTARCGISLLTNVGRIELPIHVWDGKLQVYYHFVPTSNFLTHDVGIIYTGNEDGPVTRTLSLLNPNPVVVKIRKFDAISPYVFARVIGVAEAPNGNVYTLTNFRPLKEITLPSGEIPIPPNHFALVEFYVNATEPPAIDSLNNILMWVVTDQPNRTPIVGSILFDYGNYFSHPDPLIMENCFPGRLCTSELVLSHTYRVPYRSYSDDDESNPHQLQFIEFFPDVSGLSYHFDSNYVFYAEKTKIATITYDASAGCGDSCYIGLGANSNLHAHWLAACSLDSFTAALDTYLVHQMQRKWKDMRDTGRDLLNVTLALLTTELMPHLTMPHHSFLQIRMAQPQMIHTNQPVLTFNVVEVGQFDMLNFTITNPSFLPVAVQLVLLENYPNAMYRLLPSVVGKEEFEGMTTLKDHPPHSSSDDGPFTFLDMNFTVNYNQLISRDMSLQEQAFPGGVRCSSRSLVAVLKPRSNFTVHVRFAPSEALEYKSVIILRNNLTFIESIPIRGQGGQGDLMLTDFKGRHLDQVEITYTAADLADCLKDNSIFSTLLSLFFAWFDGDKENEPEEKSPYEESTGRLPSDPPFTMHRSLVLRNMGRLPVYVTSVTAFGLSTGLRLTDISGSHNHVIPSNGTINFKLSFSPDFNDFRYMWTLAVNSTSGTVKYPVIVTLPPNLIAACHSALPRPSWESMLHMTVIFIVVPNVIGALLFALCDAYYITSVVRQLKAHLSMAKRQQSPAANAPVSAQVAQQHRGTNVGGKSKSGSGHRGEHGRKIQIRVSDSQSVIGTVISEPKFSRRQRIWNWFKELIFKLLCLLWSCTFKWLWNRIFSSSKLEKADSNDDSLSHIAANNANAARPPQPSNDNRRSKNSHRSSRPRQHRMTGFRRLYGQLLPNNLELDDYESSAISECRNRTIVRTTVSSGNDIDQNLRRKPMRSSKASPAAFERKLSPQKEKLAVQRHSSSELNNDDDYKSHEFGTGTGDDESVVETSPSVKVKSSHLESLAKSLTKSAITGISLAPDGRNDGQSADDECSSVDSDQEDDEADESGFEHKTSGQSKIAIANTSDEEHYQRGKQSSSSSVEMNVVAASSLPRVVGHAGGLTARQQKTVVPNRFHSVTAQASPKAQHGDWHSRKQQRLSEQPPRLQRRHFANVTPDRSPQRQVTVAQPLRLTRNSGSESVSSTPVVANGTSAKSSPLSSPLAAAVFYSGVPTAPANLPATEAATGVSHTREANTPYLIAEATMKRVLCSHVTSDQGSAKSESLAEAASTLPSVPCSVFSSLHPSSSPWSTTSTLSVVSQGPSIADAVILSAAQAAAQVSSTTTSTPSSAVKPKVTERAELATPSTFSPSSAAFVPSAAAFRHAPADLLQRPPAVSPSSIPSLQFAERLLDEPETTNNFPHNTEMPRNLPGNVAGTNPNPWSWEMDSIWNPQPKVKPFGQTNTNWDPWAAQIVRTLWGSPDEKKAAEKDGQQLKK